jgi:hypothetical protein
LDDGIAFGAGQDADFGEHPGMSDGAAQVVAPETPVEADGFREGGEVRGGAAGEPAGA